MCVYFKESKNIYFNIYFIILRKTKTFRNIQVQLN